MASSLVRAQVHEPFRKSSAAHPTRPGAPGPPPQQAVYAMPQPYAGAPAYAQPPQQAVMPARPPQDFAAYNPQPYPGSQPAFPQPQPTQAQAQAQAQQIFAQQVPVYPQPAYTAPPQQQQQAVFAAPPQQQPVFAAPQSSSYAAVPASGGLAAAQPARKLGGAAPEAEQVPLGPATAAMVGGVSRNAQVADLNLQAMSALLGSLQV
jgi:hypothetical protein